MAMQGVRPNFEDAHVLDQQRGLCGVFDGHLGDEVAAFCAERLHLHLEAAGVVSKDSLLRSFASADAELRGALPKDSEAGSTATLAVVRESAGGLKVTVASCGDSRAVLWHKESGAVEVTRDHRPDDAEERKRIEAAGGTVSDEFDPPRVDGQLACSRALGAFKFKQDPALAAGAQKVSGVPEVYEWTAKPGDWLIVACDGVWDTLSSEAVAKDVSEAEAEPDLGTRLSKILQKCISKEADDNLTLLAVELGAAPEEARQFQVTAGDFLKTKDSEVQQQYQSFCRRFGYALKREIVPKAPPKAALTPAEPVPALGRFAELPAPQMAAEAEAHSAPEAAGEAPCPPLELPPLVICGPSGVGKGTLIEKIKAALPGKFGFSVSHTTRKPRPGEVDGISYHFTDFDKMKKETEETENFLEYAHVHGNMYGTSKAAVKAVQAAGKICLLDIDVQGVQKVKDRAALPDARYVFVTAPSMEELEKRLRGRGTETEEAVQKRLTNAKGEIEFCEKNPGHWDLVLVNGDLQKATTELLSQIRGWYPSLTQLMKVTAQRNYGFYIRAARELMAEDPKRHATYQLEVQGLGNAIPSAAAVVAALQADGHQVVQLATTFLEVTPRNSSRKMQTPRLAVILLNKDAAV